jgi:hypothetical protein
VEAALEQCLRSSERWDYSVVKAAVKPEQPHVPVVHIGRPRLEAYDALLQGGGR